MVGVSLTLATYFSATLVLSYLSLTKLCNLLPLQRRQVRAVVLELPVAALRLLLALDSRSLLLLLLRSHVSQQVPPAVMNV